MFKKSLRETPPYFLRNAVQSPTEIDKLDYVKLPLVTLLLRDMQSLIFYSCYGQKSLADM